MASKTNVRINGKEYYRLRVTVGKDKDGEPIVKPFYGESKRDAENKRDEWKKARNQGLKIDVKLSLTQAMYTWLWNVEKVSGNKSSSFERYEGIYRNYVETSELGYKLLDEIDNLILQSYYNKLYKSGKTYSQIKNLNKILHKFFRYCIDDIKILIINPCKGVKLKAYQPDTEFDIDEFELDDEGKIETFSEDEIKSINGMKNRKLRIIIRFVLGTGLRQGEMLALKETDIKNDTVYITKTLSLVKIYDGPDDYHYEQSLTKPKTKKSVRKVPIPSELKKDLLELSKIRKAEKMKLGELYEDNNLLFPSETGSYIDARNLLRSWKRALEGIDVPYRKFHALRHTYATQLLKNGVELLTVSRLLGHATVKTTEIYAHVKESTKQEKVQALNSLF